MSVGVIVLMVVGIVLLVGVIQGAMWTLIIRAQRRRRARSIAQLGELASSSGESFVRNPSKAMYSGSTGGPYPRARANATVALTDQRLYIDPSGGTVIIVNRGDTVGVEPRRTFRTSVRAGWTHVVLHLTGEYDIAFAVRDDPDGWVRDLRRVIGPEPGPLR